ncbi:MAG TPA: hypothetical protein PKE00_05745, partial [Planctomycetota bacterium]|nr:hypothetical protein [Planctomycetota bacterium]
MDVVQARAHLYPTPESKSIFVGQSGRWFVPPESAKTPTHSGQTAIVNEWGDPRMALRFASPTDVVDVWAAGHGVAPAGAAVLTTGDAATVATLRDVTWRAFETEMLSPAPLAESNAAMRFGKAEIEAEPDGLAMSGAMLEALSLAGILSPQAMSDTGSFAFRSGLDMWKKALSTSMAFLWITTPVNDRATQIVTGAVYMRAHLAATLAGLAFHPVSQALEEY